MLVKLFWLKCPHIANKFVDLTIICALNIMRDGTRNFFLGRGVGGVWLPGPPLTIILEMAGQRFSRMNLCKTDLVIDQLKRKGQPSGRRSLI